MRKFEEFRCQVLAVEETDLKHVIKGYLDPHRAHMTVITNVDLTMDLPIEINVT